ncbi:universal stress protein [Pseudomonas sp. N040]|uniref:universal stress protein n=1 Tax=Pseudomonas sp. N040 TaxID=2785325 RepID=UPI0018A29ED6|nr:universal stress protein [Pseudomonas sp. N040]MBF7729661.1 universal stress protein [Pseudomonas sp. N040]MBW7013303.1 universal stress protein [Pseudomonas sp. N040]
MRSIRTILAGLPPAADSLALLRAQELALKLDAALELLVCDAHADQGEFLQRQLNQLRELGIRARGEQVAVDIGQVSTAMLQACQRLDSDLLIKQQQPASWLEKQLLLPDDWHLLRDAPVPLLLVKSRQAWSGGKVLAAMDVAHQDELHKALQGNVIAAAAELCALFDYSLHVVSAHELVGLPKTESITSLEEALARNCLEQLQWLQDEYGLSENQLHIGEGPASTLIPQVARQLEVSMVVLGTVARRGLAGVLIGNTAETVLDNLDCDVLVLHPHTLFSRQAERHSHQVA